LAIMYRSRAVFLLIRTCVMSTFFFILLFSKSVTATDNASRQKNLRGNARRCDEQTKKPPDNFPEVHELGENGNGLMPSRHNNGSRSAVNLCFRHITKEDGEPW